MSNERKSSQPPLNCNLDKGTGMMELDHSGGGTKGWQTEWCHWGSADYLLTTVKQETHIGVTTQVI